MNTPQHNWRAPSSSQLMNVPALPQPRGNQTHIRSLSQNSSDYPSSYTHPSNSTAIIPFNQAVETPINPAITTTGKKGSFSIKEIKHIIDRMGGIDGIVETMDKVQKVMHSVSQIAPMAKLLMGSLLPSKKNNDPDIQDVKKEEHYTKMSYKRRHRKPPAGKIRRPYSGKRRLRSYTTRQR